MTNNLPKENGLKRIIFFPFRLVGFLARSAVVLVLSAILLVLLYSWVRSLMPMTIPEARGMTYQDFLRERVVAIKAIPDESDACFKSTFILLPVYILRTSGIPALISVYAPGGPTDLWLQQTDANYAFLLPKGKASYWRLLPMYWEAVERATWVFLVRGVEGARACSTVRPVDFSYSYRQ